MSGFLLVAFSALCVAGSAVCLAIAPNALTLGGLVFTALMFVVTFTMWRSVR